MSNDKRITVAEFAEIHRLMAESPKAHLIYVDKGGSVEKVRADSDIAANKIYRDKSGLVGVYDRHVSAAELLDDLIAAGVRLKSPRGRRRVGRPKKERAAHA